jgi:hypothetical protein
MNDLFDFQLREKKIQDYQEILFNETQKKEIELLKSIKPNYEKIIELDEYPWPIKAFLKVEPYKLNRSVELRYKKCMKNMQSGSPMLYHVHLIFALDDIYNDSNILIAKKHNYYVSDGNTRAYVWVNYPEYIKQDFVKATVHLVSTFEQCETLYNSFDSKDAAESKPEKITGMFKVLNL